MEVSMFWIITLVIITIAIFLTNIINRFIKSCQQLKNSRHRQYQKIISHKLPTQCHKTYSYGELNGKSCLVTGGNGFLGSHIVERLLSQGCTVKVFDVVNKKLFKDVEVIIGDLTKLEEVEQACRGIDIVFHCATASPFTPNKTLLHDVNVTGTDLLLRASAKAGVKKFIFTSSASVVFDGVDQKNADETQPIPSCFRDTYSLTKALAEQLVLKANGKAGMLTLAIRPHGIFGPRDPHFIPTIIDNARKGKTKFQIGDGSNIVDFTYVGNVVHAHLLAAQHLKESSQCAGNAYFITNSEPLPFWDMVSMVLVGLSYDPPYIPLSYSLCYAGSKLVDGIASVLGKFITFKPPTFTSSKVQLAGLHHYYSCKKAMKDIDYYPLWTLEEGLCLTLDYFTNLRNEHALQGEQGIIPKQQNFTLEQVAGHNTKDDAWIIVNKKVYDITDYVEDHPGGDAILNDVGGDATAGFFGDQHPPTVKDHIEEYYIGDLVN